MRTRTIRTAGRIARRRDWPRRLRDALEASAALEFDEHHYCATFAADVVEAMTGVDLMADWRGLPQRAAAARVCAIYGSVEGYLQAVLDRPVASAQTRRGDVAIRDGAIGICAGERCAFLSDRGLAYYSIAEIERGYRVG